MMIDPYYAHFILVGFSLISDIPISENQVRPRLVPRNRFPEILQVSDGERHPDAQLAHVDRDQTQGTHPCPLIIYIIIMSQSEIPPN